ncbi:MAG: glycosyltransferase family 4 protein [Bryobacteraceae bacterium]
MPSSGPITVLRPKRVAVLWTGLSGYFAACLRSLQAQGTQLFVAHSAPASNAPFSENLFDFFDHKFAWSQLPNPQGLSEALQRFKPEAIVAAGWHIPGYRQVLKSYAGEVIRIMCMDNQWHGRPKQWLGVLSSSFYVKKLCDAVWVPGERQASFAQRLGFAPSQILRGMYSCDYDKFSAESDVDRAPNKTFLFTGRLVKEKGVKTLAEAYQRYRRETNDPWDLVCCGTGPEHKTLAKIPGVTLRGFVQPNDLPSVFKRAATFVLPSYFEPWGVAVHEATAAGLPILASSAVGSTVHLVQDGYNGFIFTPGDAGALAGILTKMTHASPEQRREMGEASRLLARQLTPARWAAYLLSRSCDLRNEQK